MLKQWTMSVVLSVPLLFVVACSDDETGNENGNNTAGSTAQAGSGGTAQGGTGTTGGGSSVAGGAGMNNGGSAGAMTGMPRGKGNLPAPGTQIDRMGRPAINTALTETFNADAAKKDAEKDKYNAAPQASWQNFNAAFKTSLGILDALDAACKNQLLYKDGDDPYAPLARVLTDDQLYVNTGSGECGVYLGVEAEATAAVPAGAGKCGGRTPNDDVIERSYSVLAAGVLTSIDDTITEDDAEHSLTTFPFLAAPK